jgi:hypothetical protein
MLMGVPRTQPPPGFTPWPTIQVRTFSAHLSSKSGVRRQISVKQNEPTPDFSLVLGGPLYQMYRRAHLSGPALELLRRRVLFFTALTWLPLLLFSAIGGHLYGGQGLTFLRDIETHVRFLVALPLLVSAELFVHQQIRIAVKLFTERGVVAAEDTSKFCAVIETALKLRNSITLEFALLIFVYTVGHWTWRNQVALGTASWYALPDVTTLHLTLPGNWYGFVSIPIAQFILFRWYLRILIWFWLLWRVSRLQLRLVPTHPDRAGGIGFLGKSTLAFSPVLFAQSAVMAGMIADRIFYQGQSLMSFKVTVVILIGFFLLLVLGPLTVFTPHLVRAKLRGLDEYGTLSTSYVEDFDQKWVRGGVKDEALLGTGDIQSLADMANSYTVVREMRVVPFILNDVVLLVVASAVPLLPLVLTIMPLEELVSRLIKILF